jgi:hypothetical protein
VVEGEAVNALSFRVHHRDHNQRLP